MMKTEKILRGIIVFIFFLESVTKLFGFQFQINLFTSWGYPIWFMYMVGILELAGAMGLFFSSLRIYANIGLIGIMIGAFYTHISRNNPIQMMILAIIVSILLLIHLVIFLKRKLISTKISF